MAKKKTSAVHKVKLRVHAARLQIDFWARLQQVRPQFLREALTQAVGGLDVADIDRELNQIIGNQRLQPIVQLGIRGEAFYPVPVLLRAKPQLLGYYRLLYGVSQKEFYRAPYGRFSAMENRNQLTAKTAGMLTELCRSLAETGAELLPAVQPISLATIHDLQMLTIGPQFRGSQNTIIGKGATRQVFNLIRSLVEPHVQASTDTVISLLNAAGRSVQIAFAADPDITVIEQLASGPHPDTSIEIKGGADVSNVHNRIGEAEKSHLNAKELGFTRFWTILKARVPENVARAESPTTQTFFNLDEIMNPKQPAHARFKELLHHTLGIG